MTWWKKKETLYRLFSGSDLNQLMGFIILNYRTLHNDRKKKKK